MTYAPWTEEQAEQWATEYANRLRCPSSMGPDGVRDTAEHVYLVALRKAAEMIEAAQTVYGYIGEYGLSFSSYPPGTFIQENNTHQAKLIGVRPIEGANHETRS